MLADKVFEGQARQLGNMTLKQDPTQTGTQLKLFI